MGLETAAVVMAGITVASTVGKAVTQVSAAHEKNVALDLESKEQTLSYQQKTLSNYDAMEKVLDAQQALMTVRGTSFSSPSFNAIQRDTFNTASKRQRNLDIEHDIQDANLDIEKANVKTSLFADLFGDAADIGMAGVSFMAKMPAMGGK